MNTELRKCKICTLEKKKEAFTKYKELDGRPFFRHTCKECLNNKCRNGMPAASNGRFKKGHTGGKRFEKGHVSWSKINKGKYRFERRGIGRGTANDKDWIKAVKVRDKYTCRECGSQKNIEAHHMYDFEKYPERRFDLDNGVSLCKSCHMRITRMQEQLKSCKILWLKD